MNVVKSLSCGEVRLLIAFVDGIVRELWYREKGGDFIKRIGRNYFETDLFLCCFTSFVCVFSFSISFITVWEHVCISVHLKMWSGNRWLFSKSLLALVTIDLIFGNFKQKYVYICMYVYVYVHADKHFANILI